MTTIIHPEEKALTLEGLTSDIDVWKEELQKN